MNGNFCEKEMLHDSLSSIKFATDNYNTFANECANEELRGTFMNILQSAHQTQAEVFTEMNKRGWYQVQPAEATKVQQTKQKFLTEMQ